MKLYLGRFLVVGDRLGFSAQTLAVLAELCASPSQRRPGYGIARDTGLKSGTLYPVLIRLADRGLVEVCWEDEQPAGRPRRHMYRLTPEGLATATAAPAQAQSADQAHTGPRMRAGRRVAAEAAPWGG
jgi:DNA-binding PadR family transcriptional regulator